MNTNFITIKANIDREIKTNGVVVLDENKSKHEQCFSRYYCKDFLHMVNAIVNYGGKNHSLFVHTIKDLEYFADVNEIKDIEIMSNVPVLYFKIIKDDFKALKREIESRCRKYGINTKFVVDTLNNAESNSILKTFETTYKFEGNAWKTENFETVHIFYQHEQGECFYNKYTAYIHVYFAKKEMFKFIQNVNTTENCFIDFVDTYKNNNYYNVFFDDYTWNRIETALPQIYEHEITIEIDADFICYMYSDNEYPTKEQFKTLANKMYGYINTNNVGAKKK